MARVIAVAVVFVAVLGTLWTSSTRAGDPLPRRTHVSVPEATIPDSTLGHGRSTNDDEDDDELDDAPFAERLESDPTLGDGVVIDGEGLARVVWQDDAPVFSGDTRGSLTGRYDSDLPAGRIGFRLPRDYTEADAFTAAVAFVIESDGFAADPDGFFQLSWGLWRDGVTGLDRTGDSSDFATDTFELVEFAYFPNVSAFFGGPFLAPALFGEADLSDPAFPAQGAFANFTTLFDLSVELPLDTPLLAVLEHRPGLDSLTCQVYRVVASDRVVPLDGAVGRMPLEVLAPRRFRVDTVGLTLWNDGFSGAQPAVEADVTFHALVVLPGAALRADEVLDAVPR